MSLSKSFTSFFGSLDVFCRLVWFLRFVIFRCRLHINFTSCMCRNWHPPAAPERLAAHFQHGSSLAAFEFRASEQTFNPLHISGFVTGLNQLIPAEPMLDQIDQQRIQPVVVGERVAVFLVRAQLRAGWFFENGCSDQCSLWG